VDAEAEDTRPVDGGADLPREVIDEIARGREAEAIERLREARGLGLAPAEDAVEA